MFGRFRGAGNLAEQEGALHLGLNNDSNLEQPHAPQTIVKTKQ